jgi:hypothetical protein
MLGVSGRSVRDVWGDCRTFEVDLEKPGPVRVRVGRPKLGYFYRSFRLSHPRPRGASGRPSKMLKSEQISSPPAWGVP